MRIILVFIGCILICTSALLAQNLTDTLVLKEVSITTNRNVLIQETQPLVVVSKQQQYLSENRGNSLMNSLDRLPGVNSMQIGQGASKPMIRGLGFNRVAVLQNGIKQQGQQWGADHGLEIDQYAVENVDIVKGASSLQYGSDAIAGLVIISPDKLRANDGLTGNILANGASNNRLFGGSVNLAYQHKQKYAKGQMTYQNFEDYRVPASSFNYLGWTYPIHNKILKNTAGRELNLSLQTGIIKDTYSTQLLVSNVYSKTGFFAGAHGIPTEVNLADDGNYRNIDLPYQRVNHLKIVLNQTFKINADHDLDFDIGYQNNNRKEYSRPHTHGSNILPDSNLELELKLQTATVNAVWTYKTAHSNRLSVGINTEYQQNKIGGYSFLLPKFEQIVGGIYVIDRYRISDKLVLTSGLRYDYGSIRIHEYIDPYLPEEYKKRSTNMTKRNGDASAGLGVSYDLNEWWNMKVNLGKSFRMPTANELSSNGVHHGTFRHELGDSTLSAEKSYQLDYAVSFQKQFSGFVNSISVSSALFANYFSNFIFLNPTGEFSWLPDAGQYYKQEQSKAFRMGGELHMIFRFANILQWESSAEYVYAQDLDNKFPIPFTPPFGLLNELSVTHKKKSIFRNNRIALSHRYAGAQNRVARNELSTPEYHLFDASVSTTLKFDKQDVTLIFQMQNLLDKKHYNHLSFYRHLDLPEIGRNFRLTIQVPIGAL